MDFNWFASCDTRTEIKNDIIRQNIRIACMQLLRYPQDQIIQHQEIRDLLVYVDSRMSAQYGRWIEGCSAGYFRTR
jgi:hypothetical protein